MRSMLVFISSHLLQWDLVMEDHTRLPYRIIKEVIAYIHTFFNHVQPPSTPVRIDVKKLDKSQQEHNTCCTRTSIETRHIDIIPFLRALFFKRWIGYLGLYRAFILQRWSAKKWIAFIASLCKGPKLCFHFWQSTRQIVVKNIKKFQKSQLNQL